MAWRSSGADNNGMVSNLKRFGVISSMAVEEGFRNVDRRLFVPKNLLPQAYSDQPLKEGNIHISAPHIYGSVLESLELRRESSLSFLNVGSGTGYLTCIAAAILGPRSIHYCIDVHEDVIEHFKEAVASWKEDHIPARNMHHIHVIRGNALELDTKKGECALGFDRVYIGAAMEKHQLLLFKTLLKPGGILVGPVDDELVKVTRIQIDPNARGHNTHEFSQQVLTGVRFASLISSPAIRAVIPVCVWDPALHQSYPDGFRDSSRTLLLCSRSAYQQPMKPHPKDNVNAACMLPVAMWLEILTYTHRDWFQAPQSEVAILRRRLKEEQSNAERANLARLEADSRCHLAEKEKAIYKLLARRWKSRLNAAAPDDTLTEIEDIEEAAAAMLLGGRNSLSVMGLETILRRFQGQGVSFGESDDDDEIFEANDADSMIEDDADGDEEMSEQEVSVAASVASVQAVESPNASDQVVQAYKNTQALAVRSQIRTVSITDEGI